MYTYQDLQKVGEGDAVRMDFVRAAIESHKGTTLYHTAIVADEYDRHQNRTIIRYRKLLYTMSGEAVPDNFSANYKLPSNFFNRFVVQETQYLLGNGVTWENGDDTADQLGKDFDMRLQELAKSAIVAGVAFGFFNMDHLEVFELKEFVPLYDEDNGALMAGIRFWQVDYEKPLRATLYEIDGYTDYLWDKDGGRILHEKRPYQLVIQTSEIDGTEIYDGENYPTFPIVPLWGNPHHQSLIVGLRDEIDAYDLIQSGFADDLDDASQIYWTIQNAEGMDDVDLATFIKHMKTVKAAVVEDNGAKAEAHTLDVPYAARETILSRLENTMYKDAMALNPETIAGGAATATQIKAAYEPLNNKTDEFEGCVIDFLQGIMTVAGIDDAPTFTRSILINTQEEVQTVLSAATYLPQDYVTRKILTILGDGDKADEIIDEMNMDDMDRMTGGEEEESGDEEGTGVEDLIANLESQLDDLDAQLAELESTGSDEGDEDEEDEEEEEEE